MSHDAHDAHHHVHDDDAVDALAARLPPVVTLAEAARILGLAPHTLRNRKWRGDPPHALPGLDRRVRYSGRELARFIAGGGR